MNPAHGHSAEMSVTNCIFCKTKVTQRGARCIVELTGVLFSSVESREAVSKDRVQALMWL